MPNVSVSHAAEDDASEKRFFKTLSGDIHEVTADLNRRGIRTFSSTFEDIEAFYLDGTSRHRLAAAGRFRRFFLRLFWLIKSLLMKLTPARRIMLAFAILIILPGIHIGGEQAFRVDMRVPLVSLLIVVVVLMLELKDKLIARNELVAGRAVQLALMPPESPAIRGWDVWLYTQPANDVGGDLVDHLQFNDQQHGIALGDVAGKALPAALLMVKLQATLRALVPLFPALGALGAGVNRILNRDGLPNRFATLVYLVLTPNSGHVRYLNAGHLPPQVIRGASSEDLPGGSIALGFVPEAEFTEQSVELATGDVLVVVSDGVVEAMNAAGDFFGDDRLRAAITAARGRAAKEMGRSILAALEAFVGETKPHDDISVVVIRRQMHG